MAGMTRPETAALVLLTVTCVSTFLGLNAAVTLLKKILAVLERMAHVHVTNYHGEIAATDVRSLAAAVARALRDGDSELARTIRHMQ